MSHPVVVVGGGITGLAAAFELMLAGRDCLLLEADSRLGGKVETSPLADSGLAFEVDSAADGFLARVPDAVELCREVGLGDDLAAPAANQAFVWTGGQLRAIPAPSVLGVPLDTDSLAASGIVSPAGTADFATRMQLDREPLAGDASVGEVLRPRVGNEVFERLVDPLLGGISAGNAEELSIEAGAGALAEAARRGGPFRAALRSELAESPRPADGGSVSAPVFNGIRGGTGRLVAALAHRLGSRVRLRSTVSGLRPDRHGWQVAAEGEVVEAAAVILTAPGWVTAGLVAPHAPAGAAALSRLEYSDVMLATFVIDRACIDHPLDGSGFLVPRSEGLLMTACSWASSKWAHLDDGDHAVLRVSAGRSDDRRWQALQPVELIATLLAELRSTIGLAGEPTTVRLSPWRRSLPQYRTGHLDRCDDLNAELEAKAPGLAVCGAATRGLGIPACIRGGRAAARRLLG